MSRLHLLHIPKTGGSALKNALRDVPGAPVVLCKHFVRLADILPGDRVVFSVRNPVDRFVSGFNARMRNWEDNASLLWRQLEREAFTAFPTANHLAEGLSDPSMATREFAIRIIRSLFHTGVPLSFWLGSVDYLRSRRKDVVMVALQPRLTADFEILKRMLGLPDDVRLPSDEVGANRTPQGVAVELSALGAKNIANWYNGDFALFEAATALRDEIISNLQLAVGRV